MKKLKIMLFILILFVIGGGIGFGMSHYLTPATPHRTSKSPRGEKIILQTDSFDSKIPRLIGENEVIAPKSWQVIQNVSGKSAFALNFDFQNKASKTVGLSKFIKDRVILQENLLGETQTSKIIKFDIKRMSDQVVAKGKKAEVKIVSKALDDVNTRYNFTLTLLPYKGSQDYSGITLGIPAQK